jgi:hypothetical protein
MTLPRLAPLALGALAAGAALTLAAACGSAGGSSDKTFSHAAVFVVTGSHQALACSDCHDPAKPTFALAGGGVDCLHCHAQADVVPIHSGVSGFAYDDASCIGCHKDGTVPLPANHDAQLFPVTGTPHASVACAQCHGPTRALADLKCLGCHAQADMATTHAAVPASTTGRLSNKTYVSYQYALTACMTCHADGGYHISQHPSVNNGLNGNGHRPFCLVCHQTTRPAGGVKPWGADFSTSTCLDCHTSNSGGGG